jgi:hypothetical protein
LLSILIEAARQSIILTISTMLIVANPVYLSFVVNGFLVSWTLPEMFSVYVAFLALIQCNLISIIGDLIAGVSTLTSLIARRFSGALDK